MIKMKTAMYGVFADGTRVGSVMHFAGQPVAMRWVAYSLYRDDPKVERREQFRTKREAVAWLLELHSQHKDAAK